AVVAHVQRLPAALHAIAEHGDLFVLHDLLNSRRRKIAPLHGLLDDVADSDLAHESPHQERTTESQRTQRQDTQRKPGISQKSNTWSCLTMNSLCVSCLCVLCDSVVRSLHFFSAT